MLVAKVIQSKTGNINNEIVLILFQLLLIINKESRKIPALPTNPPLY